MTDNIVHLVLARTPNARRQGHLALRCAQVPCSTDGTPGERNDAIAYRSSTFGIHGSPDGGAPPSATTAAPSAPGRRGESRPRLHVHHDERRLLQRRPGRRGDAERAYQQRRFCPGIESRNGVGVKGGPKVPDHQASRCPPHADGCIRASRPCVHPYVTAAAQDNAHAAIRRVRSARPPPAQALPILMIPVVKGWSTESAIDIASPACRSMAAWVHRGNRRRQHLRDARITAI